MEPHARKNVAELRYHLKGKPIKCSFEEQDQTQKA